MESRHDLLYTTLNIMRTISNVRSLAFLLRKGTCRILPIRPQYRTLLELFAYLLSLVGQIGYVVPESVWAKQDALTNGQYSRSGDLWAQ